MIKTDTINQYNQVLINDIYTVKVQFELKLWDKLWDIDLVVKLASC